MTEKELRARKRERRALQQRVKARREWRRLVCGIAVLALVVVTVIAWQTNRKAEALDEHSNKALYYTSVEIKPGDTIWTIAQEYMSPEWDDIRNLVKEIKRINHCSDLIYSGGYLIVPYYTDIEPTE